MKVRFTVFLSLFLSLCIASSADDVEKLDFNITWPLSNIAQTNKTVSPLLIGTLTVTSETQKNNTITINIKLSRPTGEENRKRWNKKLMYLEYDWMDRLRVWDEKNQWLYPNLTYLFKLHGKDRIERYGGWDKGHNVDNDFGAVLIRKYNKDGTRESPSTEDRPLVSAAWYPVGVKTSDKFTVVHETKSDDFTVNLTDNQSGRIKVWLIYADFMKHSIPDDWPDAPEFNGGILNFFYIDWHLDNKDKLNLDVKTMIPDANTDFDWESWVMRYDERDAASAKPVLSDQISAE